MLAVASELSTGVPGNPDLSSLFCWLVVDTEHDEDALGELADKLEAMRLGYSRTFKRMSSACSKDAKKSDKDPNFLKLAAYACPAVMTLVGLFSADVVSKVSSFLLYAIHFMSLTFCLRPNIVRSTGHHSSCR